MANRWRRFCCVFRCYHHHRPQPLICRPSQTSAIHLRRRLLAHPAVAVVCALAASLYGGRACAVIDPPERVPLKRTAYCYHHHRHHSRLQVDRHRHRDGEVHLRRRLRCFLWLRRGVLPPVASVVRRAAARAEPEQKGGDHRLRIDPAEVIPNLCDPTSGGTR